MVSQYLFYQANMFCFQALAPICAMGTSIDEQRQFSQWYIVQFLFFFFLFAHQIVCVTLLRALRPDVGGWVTLSPRYWTGVPSGTDGGRAPYSAVLDEDLSWSSKLACCLPRQCKRICAKAETSQ